MIRLAVLIVAITYSSTLLAELRLPNVFGDHMVLQRDQPVTIWGWAGAGERVTVQFAGQEAKATSDDAGAWTAQLEAMPTNFEGQELIVQGESGQVKISDVLIGEVWVCGGQSNMEWTLRGSRDADIEIPSANWPAIRYLRMPKIASLQPESDFPLNLDDPTARHWKRCTADQVENCTGVGYYFARRLHRRLGCPIGLIDTSWGGTMAQHWVSKDSLRGFPEVQSYFDSFNEQLDAWNDGGGKAGATQRYEADLKKWESEREAAKKEGRREPRRPNPANYESPAGKRQPGGMFNGMILPISKFTIQGVLFYQGENNSFTVGWKPFPKTFPAIIRDWRSAFDKDHLPFGIIQIAGWSNRRSMTYDMNHHTNIVREVQHLTWKNTPNTGLIVTFDTNSNGSIHPGRKLPVGERSARWALSQVYDQKAYGSDQPLQWTGPVYESMQVDGDKVNILFEEHSANGLRLDQDAAMGFYIAGQDRDFHIAEARITSDENRRPRVTVWSKEVPQPAAVRYAWSNLPLGTLMNGRELPAYPFRTDDWPLVPHQSTGEYHVGEALGGK